MHASKTESGRRRWTPKQRQRLLASFPKSQLTQGRPKELGFKTVVAVTAAILDGLVHNAYRLDAALVHVSFQELSVLELTFPEPTIKFGL